MKKAMLALFLVLCMVLTASPAFAESVWDLANSQQYGRKAAGMFGRGLLNVVTSPLDLVVQTVEHTKEGPPLFGTLTGLASGLGCTAIRASSGLLDVATFWAPNWNGFQVSRSYHNCLESNYPGVDQYQGMQSQTNFQPAGQAPAAPAYATPDRDVRQYVDKGGSPYDYVKKGAGGGRRGRYIK